MTVTLDPLAAAADQWERANGSSVHIHPTPGAMAAALTDGREKQRAHLDLIDTAMVGVRDGLYDRVMVFMPPQVGKSRRVSEWTPAWILQARPHWRVVVASYAAALARKRGRWVRNLLRAHPELGLRVANDSGAMDLWDLADHDGGMQSIGVEGGLTGHSAHVAIIDDPFADRKAAQSELIRQNVYDWYRDVLELRLQDEGAVVLMMTRWHEDDLAGRLLREEGRLEDGGRWHVIVVPALAEEGDILGRALGEPIPHPRISPEEYKQRCERTRVQNPRTFASLLQQRPSPDEGDIFLRAWWKTWTGARWVADEQGRCYVPDGGTVITSWDMAFKDTKASDYVVGQVWELRGTSAYLLDQVRGRMAFTATADAVRQVAAKWPQATHVVEDKANGTAVIDSLKLLVPGFVAVNPKESKEARAHAVTPFVEGGNVWLPDPSVAPWVGGLIEECAAFPNSAHDDQVDSLTQALSRFFLKQASRKLRMRGGGEEQDPTPWLQRGA